jgi:kanamycin kinase
MEQEFIDWAHKKLGSIAAITKEPYGDQSNVYHLQVPNGDYFLKIGKELSKERERLEWLENKLPVPKVIGFTTIENKDALLLSAIEGKNLAKLCKEWSADQVADSLADALRRFHSADTQNCPFGNPGPDKVLIHGDACLPNIVFQGDELAGYIDLGDMTIGNPEVDFAAAIWSLQYNLGPGHGLEFLKRYGVRDATEAVVERLRLQYEKMQEQWGL